jgi:hypothetical protein
LTAPPRAYTREENERLREQLKQRAQRAVNLVLLAMDFGMLDGRARHRLRWALDRREGRPLSIEETVFDLAYASDDPYLYTAVLAPHIHEVCVDLEAQPQLPRELAEHLAWEAVVDAARGLWVEMNGPLPAAESTGDREQD